MHRTANRTSLRTFTASFATALLATFALSTANAQNLTEQAEAFESISSTAKWSLIGSVELPVDQLKPQGLTKVGDYFYVSGQRRNVSHLIKINSEGLVQKRITLEHTEQLENTAISFDGESLWLIASPVSPLAESVIYRIDPLELQAEVILQFSHPLDAIIHDSDSHRLHGLHWETGQQFSWEENQAGYEADSATAISYNKRSTDYGDCQHLSTSRLLCSGLMTQMIDDNHQLSAGVIDLMELDSMSRLHQIYLVQTTADNDFFAGQPFFFDAGNAQPPDLYFVISEPAPVLYHYKLER